MRIYIVQITTVQIIYCSILLKLKSVKGVYSVKEYEIQLNWFLYRKDLTEIHQICVGKLCK